jgi:hypothetical protein
VRALLKYLSFLNSPAPQNLNSPSSMYIPSIYWRPNLGVSYRTCIIWCVNSDHSIIVECSKGKQTYLHSLSLKNQIPKHRHFIAYNNIYSLTLMARELQLLRRWILIQKLFLNLLENKIRD